MTWAIGLVGYFSNSFKKQYWEVWSTLRKQLQSNMHRLEDWTPCPATGRKVRLLYLGTEDGLEAVCQIMTWV